MYELGLRIKHFREQINMSQKEFAVRINKKNTTVSNWENGLSRPDADVLSAICMVLNVSPDELLDVRGLINDIQSLSQDENLLIKKYRALDERGKNAVKATLDNEYKQANPDEAKTPANSA